MKQRSNAALALKRLRERTGLSVREAARAADLKPSSYSYYEDKFKGDFLPAKLVRALSGVFSQKGVENSELFALAGLTDPEPGARPTEADSGKSTHKYDTQAKNPGAGGVVNGQTLRGPRDLPVLGAAKGGHGGVFMENGQALEHIARPSFLADVRDAYAVYMVGYSMEPRYFAGETLFVHPHRPVRQNDFVVIQLAPETEGGDMEYMVKQFVRQDARRLQVREYGPKTRMFELPASRVIAVHKIVGAAEAP